MSTDSNQLAPSRPAQTAIATNAPSPLAFMSDTSAFNHLWRIATGYAKSNLVPMQFRGHIEDCFIICQLSLRMNVDPFMLMQATYIVHGKPGFEAKLAIALLNSSGKIRGTLKTEFSGKGDDYGCRAWAIDAYTGEKVTGPRVTLAMVKGEGWNVDKKLRDGGGIQKSKWNTMADLMFVYRASSFFVRTNYPEVLMGMPTREELEDVSVADASNQSRLETLLATADTTPADAAASREQSADESTTIDAEIVGDQEPDRPEEAEAEPAASTAAEEEDQAILMQEWREAIAACTAMPELLAMPEKLLVTAITRARRLELMEAINKREKELKGGKGGQKTMV